MSRDWVIDKLKIGVTYDTDLDKVRKLIKQIGKDCWLTRSSRPTSSSR